MDRFEFDSKTGPNDNRKNGRTCHGAVEVFPWEWPTRTLISLDIRGPQGAARGGVVLDRATAIKLGGALLAWAMPDNKSLRAHLGDLMAAIEAIR